MKLAIPDLISNSYFPALAAAELGHFARHGLDSRGRADLPGRSRLRGDARRRIRFCRRRGAWRARRVSRMARRQAAGCAGAGHVLVSGDARRPRDRARRPRGAQGQAHRRGALGRDGAAPAADRRRPRPRANGITIAAGAGRDRRDDQFRPDRGTGPGKTARSTGSGPTAWRPRSR